MKLIHRPAADTAPLRALAVFRGCPESELQVVRSLVTAVTVADSTTLVVQGEPASEFFIIEQGRASVVRSGEPVAELGTGEFFGEIALIDGEPRTATVRAASDMRLFVQANREFTTMLRSCPTVARNVMHAMAQRLRAA